ncbi:MAG: flagellar hook-associated protein FlgK [Pseudomonadota bacterium]
MADFLSTSVSGLSSVQRALDVLSHNISNAYTEGYTRQSVTLATRVPQYTGQGAVGTGTALVDISRAFDQFLGQTLQTALTEQGRLQARSDLLGRVEDALGDDTNNMSTWMMDFFNAAQDLSNNPSDTALRTALLGQAENLVSQAQNLDRRFSDIETSVARQFSQITTEINGYTKELANLNASIRDIRNKFPDQQPNDLLDRRDLILRKLAENVDISTFQDGEGNINVTLGNGDWLVLSDRQNPLVAAPTGTGFKVLVQEKGTTRDITDQLAGGKLGGLVRAKQDVLDPLRAELGRLVFSFASAVNDQHALGEDLDGNAGTYDFFKVSGLPLNTFVGDPKVEPSASGVTMSITNVSELTASDFRLKYVGGQWNLYKVGNDTPLVQGLTGTYAVPGEGITIDASSLPATPGAGDATEILVRPMGGVLSALDVDITDPRAIAAAGVGVGPGDNSNIRAWSNIANSAGQVAGQFSLSGAYANTLVAFGSEARATNVSLEAQDLYVKQTSDRREAVVGVNLDEEAAELVRLQNHYMALSKSVSVADTLFQSLLQAAA